MSKNPLWIYGGFFLFTALLISAKASRRHPERPGLFEGFRSNFPSKGLIAITGASAKRQEHFAQLPLAFDETERRGNPLSQ
jgi:hypothetical protein